MQKYIWSPSSNGFFPLEEKSVFERTGDWPADGVEVSESTHAALFPIPVGKCIGTVNGYPEWVDLPQPTHEEIEAHAAAEKKHRLDIANEHMNSNQWPGKAALGRLKDDELMQYNLWLDYLDELNAVDITTAPDINWPVSPAV